MTTERNVLATIRAHAESHRRMADCDAYSAQEAPRLESALAAVADLVERLEASNWRLSNLLALIPEGRPERAQIEQDMADNRAALAPFQTGGVK